jgi:hypothetical protein
MSSSDKLVTRAGIIALFSAIPLAAQIANSVKFTAPFPFYVGDTRMPSGSYFLTQPEDLNNAIVVVKSADGRRSAFIGVTPTQSLEPPRQSKIIFEKYGDTLYFNRVLLDGDPYGIVADSTKAEKKAEQMASVAEERSITIAGQ